MMTFNVLWTLVQNMQLSQMQPDVKLSLGGQVADSGLR